MVDLGLMSALDRPNRCIKTLAFGTVSPDRAGQRRISIPHRKKFHSRRILSSGIRRHNPDSLVSAKSLGPIESCICKSNRLLRAKRLIGAAAPRIGSPSNGASLGYDDPVAQVKRLR